MDPVGAVSASTVLHIALSGAREWQMVHDTIPVKPHTSTITGNQPIFPPNLTLVNSDASWFQESSAAGFGWVLEESQRGILIEGSTHSDFVSSPFVAEALALREAMVAVQHSPNVRMRSDNLKFIKTINSKSFPMELYGVLKDIKYLSLSFDFIFFSHVQRSCNVLAEKRSPLCHPTLY
ncbi:hypothetical protein IGI04_013028 [Brassica rapa subsp. trilocularis]|uniref:RNase H type-1 domain-containing protein n=1 Tax=Brassica rapa subsp. trilocularis TaxID=1813537 RepID=A0ABQ7N7N0_BRACM|nr:hypothetical protein IGI04_013028 [Brassica rapa subsp. trilocularis]